MYRKQPKTIQVRGDMYRESHFSTHVKTKLEINGNSKFYRRSY